MAVENKNNKNGLAKEGKEASKFPKEHSSCSNGHARQTERGSAAHSPVPQTAVQCHLEAPEAAVEEHFKRNHVTRAQVSPPPPIPAGVHLRFSISAATTCTLRPFPGERKAAHHCHC